MAPVRTQGGLQSAQQRHVKLIVSIRLKVSALLKLDSVQVLADAYGLAHNVCANLKALAHASDQQPIDNDFCIKLLEDLYVVVSNGLKLLQLSWPTVVADGSPGSATCYPPSLRPAIRVVAVLCATFAFCRASSWYKRQHMALEIDMAVKAGLWQHLVSVINKLNIILQPLQHTAGKADQQCIQTYAMSWQLASILLELWQWLFQNQPGSRLSSSALAPTVEPVASLAYTMIRLTSTTNPVRSSNSSTKHTGSSQIGGSTSELGFQLLHLDSSLICCTCKTVMTISHMMVAAASDEGCLRQGSNRHSSSSNSIDTAVAIVRTILASADVQRLMIIALGTAAAVMHRQYHDRSGAAAAADHGDEAQQQQMRLTECGYPSLLAALGVPALAGELLWEMDAATLQRCCLSDMQQCLLTVVKYLYRPSQQPGLMIQQQHAAQELLSPRNRSSSASSSSILGASQQSAGAEQLLLQQLAIPALHTLLEIAIMLPDADTVTTAKAIWAASNILQPGSHWLHLEENVQDKQQILQRLLYPLYMKLCKTLDKVSHQQMSDGNVSEGLEAINAQHALSLMEAWSLVTQIYLLDVSGIRSEYPLPDHVLEVIKQQPVNALTALETITRMGAGRAENSRERWTMHAFARAAVGGFLSSCLPDDGRTVMAEILTQPGVQLRLCSLLCCQMKLILSICTAMDSTTAEQQLQLIECLVDQLSMVDYVLTLHMTADQASEDDTAPQQSKCRVQQLPMLPISSWAAMVSKIAYAAAAVMLQCLCVDPDNLVDISRFTSQVLESLLHPQQGLSRLPADAICSDDEVEQQLMQLKKLTSSAESGTDKGTCDDSLQQQLLLEFQQCGAAICAALPVKFCCNNPACANLAKLSEQQLVAGKGSRCSGCKVARYCSRDCQLKHWKQHKKTCKIIQQAEGAADSLDGRRTPE